MQPQEPEAEQAGCQEDAQAEDDTSMKRTTFIDNRKMMAFAAAVVAASSLTACTEEEKPATHTAICVDENTGNRIDDDKCDDDGDRNGSFMWIYYPISYGHVPAVGSSYRSSTGFTTTRPAGSVTSIVPAKGGFGGTNGSTGG